VVTEAAVATVAEQPELGSLVAAKEALLEVPMVADLKAEVSLEVAPKEESLEKGSLEAGFLEAVVVAFRVAGSEVVKPVVDSLVVELLEESLDKGLSEAD